MPENLFLDPKEKIEVSELPLIPTSIVVGTTTNDNAPGGDIGEFASSAVAAFTSAPASSAWGDMIRMVLPQGDWDVSLNTMLTLGATSSGAGTGFSIAISGTSGGSSGSGVLNSSASLGLVNGSNMLSSQSFPTLNLNQSLMLSHVRMNLAASSTIFAKLNATYSAGTPLFTCLLEARRTR